MPDDSQLYLSFRPADGLSSQIDAIQAMERCIEDIRQWMVSDGLVSECMGHLHFSFSFINVQPQAAASRKDGVKTFEPFGGVPDNVLTLSYFPDHPQMP